MPGLIRSAGKSNPPTHRRQRRRTIRAFGLALAALAFAVGTAAASTQIPSGPGQIGQAVGSSTPVVVTTIHDAQHDSVTSVPAGTDVHVALAVIGSSGMVTGQVRIYMYGTADCSGIAAYVWTENLVNGSFDAVDHTFTAPKAMTKSAYVLYMGDSTYAVAAGACRNIQFTKVNPVVTLSIHDESHDVVDSVPVSEQVHASVDVGGPLGDGSTSSYVLVRGWANATCDGTDYLYTTKFLDDNGVADPVLPVGFDAAGPRSFKARFAGDAKYNPMWTECVSVQGTKIAPNLTFKLHDAAHAPAPATVLLDTPIHPFVGLAGAAGQPTGDVTIHLYSEYNGKACGVQIWQVTLPADASIDATVATQARDYPALGSWQVEYPGDAKYLPATSDCLSVRWLATPQVTLTIHDASHHAVTSAYVGTTLHARVVVGGDFGTPTGSVTVKTFTNSTCSTGASSLGSGALSGGVLDDASIDVKAASVGTIWFQATYKGSTTYASAKSACKAVDVTKAPSIPSPTQTPAPTSAPSAAPKASPATAPSTTPAPSGTPGSEPTTTPSEPVASTGPASGRDIGSTPEPTAAATAAPQSTDAPAAAGGPVTPDQGAGPDGGLAFLLALLLAGGLALIWFVARARRRRDDAAPATEPLSAAQSG